MIWAFSLLFLLSRWGKKSAWKNLVSVIFCFSFLPFITIHLSIDEVLSILYLSGLFHWQKENINLIWWKTWFRPMWREAAGGLVVVRTCVPSHLVRKYELIGKSACHASVCHMRFTPSRAKDVRSKHWGYRGGILTFNAQFLHQYVSSATYPHQNGN